MTYLRYGLLMSVLVVAQACGDDDDGSPAMQDAGELDSSTPSGGTGSGGTGSGGTGGATGGTGAAGPVQCGTMVCEAPPGAMGFASACCADAATATCGVTFAGMPCSRPPEADPRCPSVDVGGFVMLASCCTPDGECGIDATQFGAGCVELSEAAAQAMGMGGGGFMIDFPEPQSCDEGDAGTDDAGS